MSHDKAGDCTGYWAELGRLVLKRLLLLALLLDTAAEHPARPASAPLLFRRAQPLKSTAAAVAQLLAGRLRGARAAAEGDCVCSMEVFVHQHQHQHIAVAIIPVAEAVHDCATKKAHVSL